jgi:hypothetical protein
MPRVFISYSAKDTSLATRIASDLRAAGIEAWLAEEQILPGDHIQQKISDAIRRSDYFVALLSENSLKSHWVQHEIAAALRRSADSAAGRLIPVRVDDAALPIDLSRLLHVDLRSDYESGVRKLVEALRAPPPESAFNMVDLVDTEGVAKGIGQDQKGFKGSGYLVTTVLAALTLIATGVSAVSSYFQVFRDRPEVFFAVSQHQIPVPPHVDPQNFYGVLEANRIPKTTLQIDVINAEGAR